MIQLPAQISEMKDSNKVFFVELYVLHLPTGNIYLAAADKDIEWFIPNTYTPITYLATPIQRGSFTYSSGDQVSNIEITISNVTEMFSAVIHSSFDIRGAIVDIYQIAYPSSLSSGSAYRYLFRGYMDNPQLDEGEAVFKTTIMAILPNMAGHRKLGLYCSAWFGDSEECGVSPSVYRGYLDYGSTQSLIYDRNLGQGTNYWKNGIVTLGCESRKIKASSYGQLVLFYPFFGNIYAGMSYTVQNGCDHSYSDCARHNNLQNFGGFPSIPFEQVVK